MKIFKLIENIIEKTNHWVHVGLAVIVLFLMVVTLYSVIMRYVFNAPPQWTSQILMLLFIPVASMGGGYVYLKDAHVRLDLIYSCWSARGKAISDVITFLPFLLLTGVLAKVTIKMAINSVAIREAYAEFIFKGPVYPRKIALAIAVILLLLAGVVIFVRNVQTIIEKSRKKAKNEH